MLVIEVLKEKKSFLRFIFVTITSGKQASQYFIAEILNYIRNLILGKTV